jgi:uncharacterized protein YraI
MAGKGKTTGNLKLRSGPGMQFEPPIGYLVPGTALEILGEEGDWLHVRAEGKEGYVGRKYVEIEAASTAPDTSGRSTLTITGGGDKSKGRAAPQPKAAGPARPLDRKHKGVEDE